MNGLLLSYPNEVVTKGAIVRNEASKELMISDLDIRRNSWH